MCMPNRKPEVGDLWNRQRQVVTEVVHMPPYGCTLSLDLSAKTWGPRVGENDTNNHNIVWCPA
jgi:hypothetical protein